MKRILAFFFCLIIGCTSSYSATTSPAAPLRVGIIGLSHDHIGSFLSGGVLVPAGSILNRADVQLVGIVEPDEKLFNLYAQRFHILPSLHYLTIQEMVSHAHPQAALVFTPPSEHRRVVETCAALGVHVLMEKPLALTYADALAIQRAAFKGHIHVLVDYETSWYPSNTEAISLLKQGELGDIVKAVVRDGHSGPKAIGVSPTFLSWLTDPKQDGDGALTDFGCYGPDLMTWIMNGEAPQSVTAVTKRMQPEVYSNVDDEAEIILNYRNAVVIVQASWNWPVSMKQMDMYGRTGYAKTIDSSRLEVRRANEPDAKITVGQPLEAPYDDPLHYLSAVINGEIQEGNSMSSLKTNITVTEILDAAWQSAQKEKTIDFPLAR